MNKEDFAKKKSTYEIYNALGIGSVLIGFVSFLGNPSVGLMLFIGGAIFTVIISSAFKKLSTAFKTTYIKQVIENLYPTTTFSPDKGFTKEEVYDTLVLGREDRFASEDMIEGSLWDRNFRCADLHLQDVRRSGKSTTIVTVFRGRFYEIEFDKMLSTPVYIVDNQSILHRFSGFEKMEMEWVAFNKTFDVFGKDQLGVFRLIKPRFMEKVVDLKEKYKRIQIGFIENKLYVAIHNGVDTFDLRMYKPIDEGYLDEIKREFEDVRLLIETLTSEL